MNAHESGRRREVPRVLIVDDEPDIRELLDLTLARMGLEADCAGSLGEARKFLAERSYQLCLTDMRLPDGSGLDLVVEIGHSARDLPVAVITAHGSAENAVSALKAGAFDYIAKPVSLDQLRGLVKSALDVDGGFGREVAAADDVDLVGQSAPIANAREIIVRLARSQAPVCITGESGSGKELAARRVHALGSRRQGPFVPVNCGAIPENLMESEFFGYRRGAFTGASEDRVGFFQAASGGTLFLDEVADLPLSMQVKLLRAIQEKRVRRVGATVEEPVDVRLICATHQNLRALVEQGRFRQDLFYRINVIELRMPALRECRDDIPALVTGILRRLSAGRVPPAVTSSALQRLADYSFPGNVRELENILERALALLVGEVIDAGDLHLTPTDAEGDMLRESGTLQDFLDGVERQKIVEALGQTGGNRTAAARLLGITFRSIRYRMARLGIED